MPIYKLELEQIESVIDRTGIAAVISGIAQICSEKADHIRENWQDENLATEWDKLAARLLNVEFYAKHNKVWFS
jgi:hypothetical protein